MSIDIRPARQWEDYVQCEQVQREVWYTPDNRDIVPASLLVTAHKNGGILLGAFDGPDMVGFVFGFPGFTGNGVDRVLKHCSHILAVRSSYRSRGLGLALKLAQREALLEQGFDLATWTYDPLLALNAHLNLNRLGAFAHHYIRDAYGEMQDELNRGVASDRFETEWWLRSAGVASRISAASVDSITPAQALYTVSFDDRGLPHIRGIEDAQEGTVLVEIPVDFGQVKKADLNLAQHWRQATRVTFESLFEGGFVATDLKRWIDDKGGLRTGYLLTHP